MEDDLDERKKWKKIKLYLERNTRRKTSVAKR